MGLSSVFVALGFSLADAPASVPVCAGLGVTFLSLGLVFVWISELFLSVMKPEVNLGALGLCCRTDWCFAEYAEAAQKYVTRRKETGWGIPVSWQEPDVGVCESRARV